MNAFVRAYEGGGPGLFQQTRSFLETSLCHKCPTQAARCYQWFRSRHNTIGPPQRLCCSCLVSITPGWRSKKEAQCDRVGVPPGKRNTVNLVVIFRPTLESCHRWCCVFHLTCVFGLLPRKWSLSAAVHLCGWKAALLLLSWILAYD